MRKHWKANRCYKGKVPNAEGTLKSLKAEQIRFHSNLKRSTPAAVAQMVQAVSPPNCEVLSKTYYYCSNCGAFTKRQSNLMTHFGGKSNTE